MHIFSTMRPAPPQIHSNTNILISAIGVIQCSEYGGKQAKRITCTTHNLKHLNIKGFIPSWDMVGIVILLVWLTIHKA